MEQIEVNSLNYTGWVVPPGEYGFVEAAGPGIIHQALVPDDDGYRALTRLGSPEPESRSQDFDGRRLVRVDGGYVVLNYMRYREKDHTAARRSKKYREKKRHAVTPSRHAVASRNVTQAEAEAEAEADSRERKRTSVASAPAPWSHEAVDDWNARFGSGAAHGGRIGKALKPVVSANGWETVRPAWRRYLSEKPSAFANPQDFAAHWRDWSGESARAAYRIPL